MKIVLRLCCPILLLSVTIVLFSFDRNGGVSNQSFPYREAGLTERQAAAHLLSRFTFGAKRGEVDDVVETGLEKWCRKQLDAGLDDNDLDEKLSGYEWLKMTNAEIVNAYVKPARILRMAVKDGVVDKDSVNKQNKPAYRDSLKLYMDQKGLKPQRELLRQLANQKILHAVYTNNQLQEVLTDFWFNHFNVSITKNDCAQFIPAYERDVIRPNALGRFEDLLLATAKSPAMLLYLDNFSSAGNDSSTSGGVTGKAGRRMINMLQRKLADSSRKVLTGKLKNRKKGLNENYAREVMELHTLGVDAGYTQNDVTEAARVLTGWTVYPMGEYRSGNAIAKLLDRIGENKLTERGFVHEGDFLFAANRHDKGQKTVLGTTFKTGGGYEEGVKLLKMLAHHPSTAKFISKKIAVRFVSDNPPQSLVDRMARTFLDKDGDIKQVLMTMVASPEFWNKDAVRAKTKSPFELAISTVRALNADVTAPYQLYNWIDKMGQKLYYYQAPTGFPDRARYWINTGALLNRMNFGLAVASQRIPGIKADLLKLNNGHEPESAQQALLVYQKLMMPERDFDRSMKHLAILINDPQLQQKIESEVIRQGAASSNIEAEMAGKDKTQKSAASKGEKGNVLSQVVGIIIGSPEFQRR